MSQHRLVQVFIIIGQSQTGKSSPGIALTIRSSFGLTQKSANHFEFPTTRLECKAKGQNPEAKSIWQ